MKVPAIRLLSLIAVVVLALPVNAEAQSREYFLAGADTRKYAVILGGIGADEKYQSQFRQWTLKLHAILVADYGYPPDHITLLLGRGDPATSEIAGNCRLETIAATMEQLRMKVQPGDQVTIFLIGHGTSDDRDAKFVIAGPDITGAEFAEILQGFSDPDIAVVNTTGSSRPFCDALAAPGRVIVCATRAGAERYDTIFARFLLEGLANHTADRDKNQRVSLFEIFLYVREKVKSWYTDQDRLPSEHPTLDDNGDGHFQTDPDPMRNEGGLAQIAELDTLTALLPATVADGPAAGTLRNLTARVRALERSVILLRNQKAAMPEIVYRQQLETFLIDLARSTRRLKSLLADLRKNIHRDLILEKLRRCAKTSQFVEHKF
ncbi:hypothetical protein D1BOALGB6SA_375 [Olavius sp. associated proteobacterium Delta 1]|nr:hypothetical protein D1BOALGB6SA_375 [Olavius sp. associated proteobacterium Delta 1]